MPPPGVEAHPGDVKDPSGSHFASADARLERRIRQRKRPIQARAAGTVEALVEATLQVLVRDGYRKLTTTRVAERAGVSVGTLYQYFPDKRALVTALKVRYFGLMTSAVERALREHGAADPRGEDVEGMIRAPLAALLEVKRKHPELVVIVCKESADSLARANKGKRVPYLPGVRITPCNGLRDRLDKEGWRPALGF